MLLKDFKITLCDLRTHNNCNGVESINSLVHNTKWKLEESDDSIEDKKLNNQEKKEEESDEESDNYEVKKVKVKRKIVRIHRAKKKMRRIVSDSEDEDSSDEDSSSHSEDNGDDDPDFDINAAIRERKGVRKREYEKGRNNKVQNEDSIKYENQPKRELSAYEQMIEKNRQEKLAFLEALKIEEAKAGLSEAVNRVKAVKLNKENKVKKQHKRVSYKSMVPVRKSKRLANISVDLSEEGLYANVIRAAVEEAEEKREIIPSELSFKAALDDKDLYDSYIVDLNIQEPKTGDKFCLYDKSVLNNMTLGENIAKVTPARTTALTWHPSPDYLILTAGDKYGNLGIWNVGSESDPYVMKIHLEGITNLQFNPFNRDNLFSSSYDGILRCGDMIQHNFSEIYNVSDETCCTYFDFVSSSTYLVAQKNGKVAIVDKRTNSKSSEKNHTCHDYSIKTVNMHPTNRNFFVTAENKGTIRLWDLRKLQKNPVADITHHKRCVHSAFFSPVTGNSILATSTDDSISIFDSTNLTSDIKLKKQMKHDNKTGRWLSIFRAIWLPNSEEAFCIGSMQYPRRIEVYDKNMFVYNFMKHDNLTTITSTNAFHPMKPALAGGNSSGKVFVFS